MRDELEIQRAHDLLRGVILAVKATPRNLNHLPWLIAEDVLCWILEHDYNTAFADSLLELEAALFSQGIDLVDSGALNTPDDESGA